MDDVRAMSFHRVVNEKNRNKGISKLNTVLNSCCQREGVRGGGKIVCLLCIML